MNIKKYIKKKRSDYNYKKDSNEFNLVVALERLIKLEENAIIINTNENYNKEKF